MSRFFGPTVFSVISFLALHAGAQTASTTSVSINPPNAPLGTPVSIAGSVTASTTPFVNPAGAVVAPTGTLQFHDGTAALGTPVTLTAGSGLMTTPFGSVFGTIDPAFVQIAGELTGDLNGDGVEDLVVYGNASSQSLPQSNVEVQSFVSGAHGGYTAAAAISLAIPASQPVSAPVLADVNGDGKLDLLIGSSVAYGNGDGTFAQPVALSFLGSGYTQTYAADVTGDGKADIVALNAVPLILGNLAYTLQVTVFANQGSGTFHSLGTFPLGPPQLLAQSSLASLTFVDLNGDGKLDMVPQMYFLPVGNAAEPATVTSVLNHGDGTFLPPVTVTYTAQQNGGLIELLSVQAADFNKDGKTDLALVYPKNPPVNLGAASVNPIVLLPGNGDGTFGPEIDSVIATPGSGVPPAGNAIVADTNLDGLPDIAFGSGAVALGDGTGHFTSGPAVGGGATALAGSVPGVVSMLLPGNAYPSLVYVALPQTGVPSTVVAAHNVTSTASLAAMTLSQGVHSISAAYSGDANYAASTSAPVVVTVAPAMSTVTVTPSANPAYVSQVVTFSIAVASSGPVPSGTVMLNNGSTTVGTGTLDAQGNATISAAFASAGSVSLTAAYGGDTTHAAASATISETVAAEVAVTASGGSTTITVASGKSISTPLSLTGNAGFSGMVSFTCTGLPSTATCTFNPATLTLAASGPQTTTLTVSTGTATTAVLADPFGPGHDGNRVTLACGIFAGSLLLLWTRRRRPLWMVTVIAGLALLPTGCGGGSSSSGGGGGVKSNNTPAGTYPFEVIATAGTVQTVTNYTLVVQ